MPRPSPAWTPGAGRGGSVLSLARPAAGYDDVGDGLALEDTGLVLEDDELALEGDELALGNGGLPVTAPTGGTPPGSPGMVYSAFHGEPDGSDDAVAGEVPWLIHLAWYGSPW